MGFELGQKIIDKFRKKNKKEKSFPVGTQNYENRNKWVIDKLKSIPSGSKILDAGAGEMPFTEYCSHLIYESQDFCQYDGKGDNKSLQCTSWDTKKIDIVCDISNIPRNNETYDVILCTEVLEHLPEPILALKEFSRLLKKGGILILTAPFCSLSHQTPYYYYNGYSTYWYSKILEQFDVQVIEQTPNGNYFEYIAQELRRLKYCKNLYSKKEIGLSNRAINKILKTLKQCSDNDNGSSEILCFGWHIVARKGN